MIKTNTHNNLRVNKNFSSSNNKPSKTPTKKISFVQKLIDEAERKITDVGPFSVTLATKNNNPAKYISSYGVLIRPENDNDKSPRVVRFFSKNESKTAVHESNIRFSGTRSEVLEYLKSGEFKMELENYIDFISEKFYMDNKR